MFLNPEVYNFIYSLPLEKLLLEVKLRVWLFTDDFVDCPDMGPIEKFPSYFYRFWAHRIYDGKASCSGFGDNIHQAQWPYVESKEFILGTEIQLKPRSSITPMTLFDISAIYNQLSTLSEGETLRHQEGTETSTEEPEFPQLSWDQFDAIMGVIFSPLISKCGRHFLSVDFSKPKRVLMNEFSTLIDEIRKSYPERSSERTAWRASKIRKMKAYRVFEIVDILIVFKWRFDFNISEIPKTEIAELVYANKPDYLTEELRSTFSKSHFKFMQQVFSREGYLRLKQLYTESLVKEDE